jgi:predicted nucleic acid-binding protein
VVLVDTSIIIGYFKGTTGEPYTAFDELLAGDEPLGIEKHVYQEVLQGAKSNKEFTVLKEFLNTLSFYSLLWGKKSYENAALNYIKCRHAGITIRSTIDMIIAETAIENDLLLLHDDTDFTQMATVIKELKLYENN